MAPLQQERLYYLAFSYLYETIGPIRFNRLVGHFGSAEAAWNNLRLRELQELGISEGTSAKTINKAKSLDLKTLERLLSSQEVKIICDFEPDFPANLKNAPDHPFLIYVRGQLLPQDVRAVAIVGTRKISTYGLRVIETFVPGLVRAGVTLVSGLAFGVDAKTAEQTLACGGRSIAVLASGVDFITPRSNELLGQQIIAKGGAIISELPLGTQPLNYYFPVRNRIISGLSLGTIVIEAAEKSGALYTASYCAEQGRVTMAVPGSIFSEVSGGTNKLIKDGAAMVLGAEDVLNEIGVAIDSDRSDRSNMTDLSPIERQIFDLLTRGELHVDVITRTLGLSASEVSVSLTMLELKGLTHNWGGGVYGI